MRFVWIGFIIPNWFACAFGGSLKCIPNNIFRREVSEGISVSLKNPSRLPPCQLVAEKRADDASSKIRTGFSNTPVTNFRSALLEKAKKTRVKVDGKLVERAFQTRHLKIDDLNSKTLTELDDLITTARSAGNFRGSRILNSAVEKSAALDNLSKLVGKRFGLDSSKASLPASKLRVIERFLTPEALKSLIGFKGISEGIASNIGGIN